MTYVSPSGRALIDRELYLPKSWTDDRDRCAEAGIGKKVGFDDKERDGEMSEEEDQKEDRKVTFATCSVLIHPGPVVLPG